MPQWWDEWELRILVLASLSAQYFLVLFTGVRKFHIPPWLRFLFRLAHIGGDTLAIFALATLVSRQKNGTGSSHARGSRELELLWAPILAMHLGGQVVITTYKIEDNEQWREHILKSLSKVTVVLYVFYKTWSSNDKRLFVATVLLFILVIIRCFQKGLDLKSSSFNALRKANSSKENITRRADMRGQGSLDDFIAAAIGAIAVVQPLGLLEALPSLPYQIFLDFPCLYSDRLTILRHFWSLDDASAYRAIEGALSAMTSFLYTKDVARTPYLALKNAPALSFRRCTQILAYATLITAICLVHTSSSHKEAYSGEDNGVTLVLLYGTLLLEVVYLCVRTAFRDKFSGRILQHNLIGYLAYNRRHSKLRIIARLLQCKDLFDDFWHIEPSYSCKEVTELARRHVRSLWNWNLHMIRDTESYKWFNDSRGEWTITRYHLQMGWSIYRPFDESIILWHLATDFCFHQRAPPDDHESARRSQEMSNYMMHLLFNNAEMLMPGSRKILSARVYGELDYILNDERRDPQEDEEGLRRRIVANCSSERIRSMTAPIIADAWGLAQSLLAITDQTRIWEVIQGVWVEMLCFSAGRCRGYLHAETLGTGVEFLSYVWVLLAHAGMETFPEKLQRRESFSFLAELQHARENDVTPVSSPSEGTVDIVVEHVILSVYDMV